MPLIIPINERNGKTISRALWDATRNAGRSRLITVLKSPSDSRWTP